MHDISDYRFKQKEIPVGEIFWDHPSNPRSNDQYGDQGHLIGERMFLPHDKALEKEVVEPMVSFGGWDYQYPIHIQKATPEEIEVAMIRLENDYNRLKVEAADSNDRSELDVFRHDYCDAKGVLKKLKWRAVTAHRRGSQLLTIRTRLYRLAKFDLEALFKVLPVLIPDTANQRYHHDFDRIAIATRENRIKTEGFRPMTDYDVLMQVYNIAVLGGRSTTWVERNLGIKGSPRVQHLGWGAAIDWDIRQQWGLRLMERLNPANRYLKDEEGKFRKDDEGKFIPDPNWLDFKKFQQKAWQGPDAQEHPYYLVPMGTMVSAQADLEKFNAKRIKDGKPVVTKLEGKEGREYFVNWLNFWNEVGTAGSTHKMLTKNEVGNLTSHRVDVVKQVATGIYNNDTSNLTQLTRREQGLNFVSAFLSDAVYPAFERFVAAFRLAEMNAKQQIELLDKLTSQLPPPPPEEKEEKAEVKAKA